MKIEIWSDIMCPFCYIGKRRLEEALATFPQKDEVEIEWKSFQLDPTITAQPGKNVYEYLAERKGMSVEQSMQMHQQVIESAKSVGLDYHFEKAVIANSFDAHRLIQLAKTKGLGDAAEERIFSAYFTEGEDAGNRETLLKLGQEIGLDGEEIRKTLENGTFSSEVYADIEEAQQLGVRGVPFFVFDRRYAVSGAQPTEVFTQTLEKAFEEN